MSKILRFLIIGDLHGAKPIIHKDLKEVDAIICPGDICGDDIRPYIKKWFKKRTKLGTDVDFNEICPPEKQEELDKVSLKKGRKVLEFLNSLGKPVFLVPGNWDQTPWIDGDGSNVGSKKKSKSNNWNKIKKGLKNIKDVENRKLNFKGVSFIGHGSVSAPEFMEKPLKKDYAADNEIYERDLERYIFFRKLFPKLKKLFKETKAPIIHLTHNVPYKTKLDKVNAPGTYAHNKHYGSIFAKELIKKFQPLVCIGGHIHEGFGKTRIRKTLCINAGFGGDVNTFIEIDKKKGKVINFEFIGRNKKN